MTLVIEDGSGVAGANSYVSAADYEAWETARFGSDNLSHSSDEARERDIFRAMDYFESLDFVGTKASQDQELQFPRVGMFIDGYSVSSEEIPVQVKSSLFELVYAEAKGYSLNQNIERDVKRRKVDAIEIEYSDNASSRVSVTAFKNAVKKLIKSPMRIKRA